MILSFSLGFKKALSCTMIHVPTNLENRFENLYQFVGSRQWYGSCEERFKLNAKTSIEKDINDQGQ